MLDPMLMLPAPAQGALAVECRADDADLVELLAALDDAPTRAAVTAERALLATLEAGCSAPVAALAELAEGDDGDEIYLRGAVISPDGTRCRPAVRAPERSPTPRRSAGARRRPPRRRRRHICTGEHRMTRTRKTAGRIALRRGRPRRPGPADPPGRTTPWSTPTTSSTTAACPESLLDARAAPRPSDDAAVQPGRGRAGRRGQGAALRGPVRAARGAPGRRRPVRPRRGGQGGAGGRPHRRAVRGRARASARPTGVATYAGVPLPGVRTAADVDDVAALDFDGARRGRRPGLARAGRRRRRPRRGPRRPARRRGRPGDRRSAVTGDGTGETQYTDDLARWTASSPPRSASPAGWCSPSAPASAQRDKLGWWENRPLYGWKVLVPRTKEQAGAMSERLRAYGAIPCEVPTIAVEPPRTPAQMERAIKGLVDGRYAWIDLHLGQRGPRGLGEVRRARPRRPRTSAA